MSMMDTGRVNPVVVLEQLPVSVLESLCRPRKQDRGLTDRHTTSDGSVPCDVIRPDTTDSPSHLPRTVLRIDGLLLGPGSCRLLDVWLSEPNSDVEKPGVTEQDASLWSSSSSLPTMQQLPNLKSNEGQRSSGEECHLTHCPISNCSHLVSSVVDHLRKDHRFSKFAIKRTMARTKKRFDR